MLGTEGGDDEIGPLADRYAQLAQTTVVSVVIHSFRINPKLDTSLEFDLIQNF